MGAKTTRSGYSSLPGAFWAAEWGRPRIYLGPDHLLCMRLQGASEEARRFYFRDITGIRCERTSRGNVISLVLFSLAILPWCTLILTGLSDTTVVSIVAGVSALIGCCGVFNLVRGATCNTWLHTTNHTERLVALGRYRTTRKALAQVDEQIRAVQEFPAADSEAPAPPPFVPRPLLGTTTSVGPMPHHPGMMIMLFVLAVTSGAASAIAIFTYPAWLELLDAIASVLLAVLAPAALMGSRGTDCPRSVKIAAGSILTYIIVMIPGVVILFSFLALDGVDIASVGNSMADLSPEDGSVYFAYLGMHSVSATALILTSFIGLIGLRLAQGRSRLAVAASESTTD